MPPTRRQQYSDWHRLLSVVDFNRNEIIGYSLYDRQTYVSATTPSLEFFQTRQSSIVNGNLTLPGQLPSGNHFLIQAIRVAILADTSETAVAAPAAGVSNGAIEDVKELIYDGVGELTINGRPFGTYPIDQTPHGGGPQGVMSNVGTGTAPQSAQYQAATNGIPDPRAVYTLAMPISLPPMTNFIYKLTWNAVKTLIIGNTDIRVTFDGQLLRPR